MSINNGALSLTIFVEHRVQIIAVLYVCVHTVKQVLCNLMSFTLHICLFIFAFANSRVSSSAICKLLIQIHAYTQLSNFCAK